MALQPTPALQRRRMSCFFWSFKVFFKGATQKKVCACETSFLFFSGFGNAELRSWTEHLPEVAGAIVGLAVTRYISLELGLSW